ncbi:MAG: flagellar basal body rod protein FlgB [Oscillospiraceae bacterium]|jgi:flagellar basal-body rod protein FlgB|nr:flagellar basal body rod protein FlgB [Oscillospiraceae bacterium]MCI1990356.1 flagellar basal body rod protein FlgB [Oscillospiraceae bacterium]MCI2034461.1 flagellar basal body rod protein FlgB [Oscillospiraceae bacterium]
MNWLNSISSSLLNKSLDGLWARQRAISDNLANIETPGYKTKSVSFEDQLRAQMQQAGSSGVTAEDQIGEIENVEPVTTEASDETFRADGNGVDLEQQNINMARTSLNYSTSLQLLNDDFSRLKTAITGNQQ